MEFYESLTDSSQTNFFKQQRNGKSIIFHLLVRNSFLCEITFICCLELKTENLGF